MQGKLLFLLLEILILPWCTITMTSETAVTPQETTTTASWLDDTNSTTESDLNATSSTTGGDFKIEMLINFIKNSVRTLKAVKTMRSVMRPILELEFLNEQSRKENENQLFLPEPLLLTPNIDRRQLDLARSRSKVSGTFPDGSNFPLSYSGFITVDRVLGNNLFFWYFPSPTDPNAPLMVWMNGGPILSSMQGLLWSHGPLTYRRTRTGYEFTKRKETWVGPFSVVYVDIVRRGYSFSNSGEEGEKADQPGYTADLHEFVKQFVVMFPESQTTGVYIAGQSYAGRFVPALAHSIHKDVKDGNREINMKGVILGAPVINVPEQDHGTLDFLYSLGVISYGDMIRKKELVRIFYDYVRSSDYKTEGQRFGAYDITLSNELSKLGHNFITGEQADYNAMQALMGSPATRLMVHAGKQKYIHVNRDMYFKFEEDYFVNTHEKLGELLDSNYKVLIFNGNIDLIVNSLSIEQAIMSIPWHGGEEYKEVARHEWRVKEDLGFYSKVDNLCRVVVHGAGHNVAHDKPAICLHMMKDFLKFGCIGEDVTIPT